MGAECYRCGYDMYDKCGHCAVVDERDRYRAALEEIVRFGDVAPGEALAYTAAKALGRNELGDSA